MPAQQHMGNGIAKARNLPGIFSGQRSSYRTLYMTLVFHNYIHFHQCPAISSHFSKLSSHFQPIPALSSHLYPFWARYRHCMSFSKHFQSVPIISSHVKSFQEQLIKHDFCLALLVSNFVTSWDSIPILMCHEMEAPHWSQIHSLDS